MAELPTSRARRVRLPLWVVLLRMSLFWLVVSLLAGLSALSWDTDQPLSASEMKRLRGYYSVAYTAGESGLSKEQDEIYVKMAANAAKAFRVKELLAEFVQKHTLADNKVLDVGAGRGYLQDVVQDYTGLDISPSAARFFHKPFVLGSATSMPFDDNSYDLVWSIWVLEHVPNPEQALSEMRRNVKDGGLLYLMPAWNCGPWLAEGYAVRPYADLSLRQKLLKAVHVPRVTLFNFGIISATPMRWMRWKSTGGPTRLHYARLQPNYTNYWQPDSDALNSLDRQETMIWFLSRGDECLNCDQPGVNSLAGDQRLIIRVHKKGISRTGSAQNRASHPGRSL